MTHTNRLPDAQRGPLGAAGAVRPRSGAVTGRSFSVWAPLPERCLFPNARPFWREKARATKLYREHVGICLYAAFQRGAMPHFERAQLSLEYAFATRRRRDGDSLQSAWKAGVDALVDVGLLPDDSTEHLSWGAVGWHLAAKGEQPGVVATICDVGAAATGGRERERET